MDKRFSRTSDSSTTAAARQHAPPYLNDLRRTCAGRGDVGNTEEIQRKKGKVFSFPERPDGVLNIVSLRMYTLKRKSSLFLLLCTTEAEMEDTNYLYMWTFAFCLLLYKRKERKKKNNDFGEMQKSSL